MRQIEKNYSKLIKAIKTINDMPVVKQSEGENNLINLVESTRKDIINAMDKDFDTPVALASILSLIRIINRELIEHKVSITIEFKDRFFEFIEMVEDIFGIFPNLKRKLIEGSVELTKETDVLNNNLVSLILDIRESLREKKLYKLSDKIRDSLRDLGIEVEDK